MSSDGPTWAKAPAFSEQPAVLARLREATAADRHEYLRARLQPVECRRCGTCVLVKKNSPKHTSVQWTADATRSCAEFAARAAQGENTALIDACPDLQASIEHAAREGLLDVPDDRQHG